MNILLRDISKSEERLRYCLNSKEKYFILQPSMHFFLGLTGKIQLRVKSISEKTKPVTVNKTQLKNIQQTLDEERYNYLGEVDAKIPKKLITNKNVEHLTAVEIEDLYNQGLYYKGKEALIEKPSA